MTKRWPDTHFWWLTESTLRVAFGPSWRRRGEDLFGLGRGELRQAVDRPMSTERMIGIEIEIAVALRKRAAELRAQADAVSRSAAALDESIAYRRRDYMKTPSDRLLGYLADLGFEESEAA
jgi:hypothetical protein